MEISYQKSGIPERMGNLKTIIFQLILLKASDNVMAVCG